MSFNDEIGWVKRVKFCTSLIPYGDRLASRLNRMIPSEPPIGYRFLCKLVPSFKRASFHLSPIYVGAGIFFSHSVGLRVTASPNQPQVTNFPVISLVPLVIESRLLALEVERLQGSMK